MSLYSYSDEEIKLELERRENIEKKVVYMCFL